MNIQQQEEIEYTLSARFDRFDGFDRGDLDHNDVDEGEICIGRMRCYRGTVEIIECYSGDLSLFEVRLNGVSVSETFDDVARARTVARWWLAGCYA